MTDRPWLGGSLALSGAGIMSFAGAETLLSAATGPTVSDVLTYTIELTAGIVVATSAILALVVPGARRVLGYVIASFARTEEAANGITSVVQFPLMFLSGTFFPIDAMPDALKTVARALPLTYLGDGLRQVMVDGTPFSPLWVCFAVLAVWLVACFGIAARFFKWQ